MNKKEALKIICDIDNKNQCLFMTGNITRSTYNANKEIIHNAYDSVNMSKTLNYSKTINSIKDKINMVS